MPNKPLHPTPPPRYLCVTSHLQRSGGARELCRSPKEAGESWELAMQGTERPFVWSRSGAEAGQELISQILPRKEAERCAGQNELQNVFWWGIGNSLGPNVRIAGSSCGGELDIQFSVILSDAKERDKDPGEVWLWTQWEDGAGRLREVPKHVLVTSRGDPDKTQHYALTCRSPERLELLPQRFDPALCTNYKSLKEGKRTKVGGGQSTFLVVGNLDSDHNNGKYNYGFRAKLIAPWCVKLVARRKLSPSERSLLDSWKAAGDWLAFVQTFRG